MIPNKITNTVTLTAGGNKTFSELTRGITSLGTIGLEFVGDSGLSTTVTVLMQIRYGTEWVTLVDSAGSDVTGTVAASGTLVFSNVNVPAGADIRPLFVTNATGDIDVTSWA